ncbi:MAG: PEP-CTERM sorting domain-containing protein [Pleurocapsa sp.]
MNDKLLILISSTIFATGLTTISTAFNPAAAYTLTNDPNCDAAALVFSPAYSDCVGAYELDKGENDVTNGDADNIVNRILNEDDIFGVDNWTFGAKFDDSGYQGVDGLFALTGLNNTTGTITLNKTAIENILGPTFEQYEIAISFKAAKNFSIYKWDAPLSTNIINWSTEGTATNNLGIAQGLSHASLYVRKIDDTSVTEVPEPGTIGSMAFLALGAIIHLKKQKFSN